MTDRDSSQIGAVKNAVSLKPVEVPKDLQKGEKFIKWDEDSAVGTPVTLRVDEYGFYLHWMSLSNESDLLDIATIRDTRTGKYAKIPKDPKLRHIVTMGSQDTLEEKTLTVCCASDFVTINFINFCCSRKEIAQIWTEALMNLACNLNQTNGSTSRFLLKAHTKLTLSTDKAGKIPVKNIIKLFAQNKDDKKRVENALDASGLLSGKNDTIEPEKFRYDDFFNFYQNFTQRREVEKVFNDLVIRQKRDNITIAQLVDFLNKTQRDPRLNEILHPCANTARARDILAQYEPNKYNVHKGQMSFQGFLRYLMSEDNNIISQNTLDLSHEMDHPLPHYFINSSHNTYLIGPQFRGKSNVEIYRQCLLAGCRCVELDFWNGRDEPIIVHGRTFVQEIYAKDVLEAIAESAFKTSDFPVVLSFENHCNPRQQAKIAYYCREIFGDMLLDTPLESHKLEQGAALPSPSLLKRKIIIKNKKKHHHHHKKFEETADQPTGNGDVPHHAPPLPTRQDSIHSISEDEDTSGEEEAETNDTEDLQPQCTVGGEDLKQHETEAEISALVNYIQPVRFSSFENSRKKNRSYEMSSFEERLATTLLKENPIEFVNYNKHQLSRVYPHGTRLDSSNFMPQLFWNAGCQLVALNFQTLDLSMQLDLGIFEYNMRCGYLLKPEFMRRTDRRLDPFAESTVDGLVAGTVQITVISGQFLTDRRVGTYVEVDMYGLPADTIRKKYRTKVVQNNAINPQYDGERFVFKKVVLPELASIRIAAYEEPAKLLGHRILPVVGLCPGYRHVNLRNELGQPLPLATLFLHIVVKDYVPDDLLDFAEALANPIKYQSDLEKRQQQLEVFTDGMEPSTDAIPENDENGVSDVSKIPKESTANGSSAHKPLLVNGNDSVEVVTDNENTIVTMSTIGKNTLVSKSVEYKEEKIEELVAEPLDTIMENKLVKEKKNELDKVLEALWKKHEKRKITLQAEKCGESGGFINIKLKERFSTSNIPQESPSTEPLTSMGESQDCVTILIDQKQPHPSIKLSERERLLNKDFVTQERELREKYQEAIFVTAEKIMQSSQRNQIKSLKAQLEQVIMELRSRLEANRCEQVKALARKHRDRGELVRMKREVANAVVVKVVSEREKLNQVFHLRIADLEKQHKAVRNAFTDQREKAKMALCKEFETRLARVEAEGNVLQ